MTPAQCRAARALIDWSQQDLSEAAQVGNATIRNFEAGKSEPNRATLDALGRALHDKGVKFTNGNQPGVHMREFDFKALDKAPWGPWITTESETDGVRQIRRSWPTRQTGQGDGSFIWFFADADATIKIGEVDLSASRYRFKEPIFRP